MMQNGSSSFYVPTKFGHVLLLQTNKDGELLLCHQRCRCHINSTMRWPGKRFNGNLRDSQSWSGRLRPPCMPSFTYVIMIIGVVCERDVLLYVDPLGLTSPSLFCTR
eukprot:1042711-Amphidinium_carterae.2